MLPPHRSAVKSEKQIEQEVNTNRYSSPAFFMPAEAGGEKKHCEPIDPQCNFYIKKNIIATTA